MSILISCATINTVLHPTNGCSYTCLLHLLLYKMCFRCLLITRSQIRFLALQWDFFLVENYSRVCKDWVFPCVFIVLCSCFLLCYFQKRLLHYADHRSGEVLQLPVIPYARQSNFLQTSNDIQLKYLRFIRRLNSLKHKGINLYYRLPHEVKTFHIFLKSDIFYSHICHSQ